MTKGSASKQKGERRALITGASAGIGAAFAERLARDGYGLVIVARRRERLEELAKTLRHRCGVAVEVLVADLTRRTELAHVERRAGLGDIDLLVNNAGFGTLGSFAEIDLEKEDEEIRLNVLALVRLTHAALPKMLARGRGAIVNVSSMGAFQPGPFNTTYCATKAFVNSFTEGLVEELRGTGVRVQALCPGFTRTEFQERAGIDVSHIPSVVWMSAEDVVDASLAGLERGGTVCVPGLGNRVASALTVAVPRPIVGRLIGAVARRAHGK